MSTRERVLSLLHFSQTISRSPFLKKFNYVFKGNSTQMVSNRLD